MSIRKHRQEAALRTHARAEAAGKTAAARGSWLHRKTARVKARAERARGDDVDKDGTMMTKGNRSC